MGPQSGPRAQAPDLAAAVRSQHAPGQAGETPQEHLVPHFLLVAHVALMTALSTRFSEDRERGQGTLEYVGIVIIAGILVVPQQLAPPGRALGRQLSGRAPHHPAPAADPGPVLWSVLAPVRSADRPGLDLQGPPGADAPQL